MTWRADTEVLVIGGGNAGLSAAVAAGEEGAEVVVIDAAPEELKGGNTAYATGTMLTAYSGADDIRTLVPELTREELDETDFNSYPAETFLEDLGRLSGYRVDADLAEILVTSSLDTLQWLRRHGVRFLPAYNRQSFRKDGRTVFWGSSVMDVVGGGHGLVESLTKACVRAGVEIVYGTSARELIDDAGTVVGARCRHPEFGDVSIRAASTVIASGGFDGNPEWRARYLGPGWDLAKHRGGRYCTGDGLRMALEVGAAPNGNWSSCHAAMWDNNAPPFGDPADPGAFSRHSYPLGIVVNAHGQRFLDEGADFRNYTYGIYGKEVLRQPHQVAWQIFDAKVVDLLREEYRGAKVTRYRADDLEALAARLNGMEVDPFLDTVAGFNAAVMADTPFDPTVKDGRGTQGLPVPKSNWANTIDTPPFEAYEVTAGTAFTYGGLHIDTDAAVLDLRGSPIPGLFAAGSCTGGLFYENSISGSSLTTGSVFGRLAGRRAAGSAARASM